MTESKSKSKRLWQIFFDDENNAGDEMSDTKRVASSVKRKVTKKVEKAIPGTSGRHGVLYQGLLEDETDSDAEVDQNGAAPGDLASGITSLRNGQGEPPDLNLGQRETVLYETPRSEKSMNGVPNFRTKPFNADEWESMEVLDETSQEPPLQQLPQNGARFIIRSESDLELAVPNTKRKRHCPCLPSSQTLQKYSHSYACIVLIGVVMIAVYVLIVLAIVYGLK